MYLFLKGAHLPWLNFSEMESVGMPSTPELDPSPPIGTQDPGRLSEVNIPSRPAAAVMLSRMAIRKQGTKGH